jgi:hypothetical protein
MRDECKRRTEASGGGGHAVCVEGKRRLFLGETSMPEKQRRAAADSKNRVQPGAQRAKPADARRDPEKQKENQRMLGVGPEHKTPAMKKGHRGTFP